LRNCIADVLTRKNTGRKLLAEMKGPELVTAKAGIDHILDAQRNGEITETNILHMIENVNSAGTSLFISCKLLGTNSMLLVFYYLR